MLTLVLVWCLNTNAAYCMEQRIPMGSNSLPMACAVAGMQEAAKDAWEHPKYKLARYRCEINIPKHVEI